MEAWRSPLFISRELGLPPASEPSQEVGAPGGWPPSVILSQPEERAAFLTRCVLCPPVNCQPWRQDSPLWRVAAFVALSTRPGQPGRDGSQWLLPSQKEPTKLAPGLELSVGLRGLQTQERHLHRLLCPGCKTCPGYPSDGPQLGGGGGAMSQSCPCVPFPPPCSKL